MFRNAINLQRYPRSWWGVAPGVGNRSTVWVRSKGDFLFGVYAFVWLNILLCACITYSAKKKKCLSKWWSPWPPCGARASPETEDQLEGSGRGRGERWWWLHLWPWWWRWIQARLSTFRPTVARKTVCIRGGHWACLTLSALSLWKEGFLGSFQVLKASKFPRMLNPSQRGGHGYGHVSLSYPHATVTSDL